MRFVVLNDAGGRGKLDLAVRKDVELLDDFLRIAALRQMNEDFNGVGGIVVDVFDLDLALGVGGQDRLDE